MMQTQQIVLDRQEARQLFRKYHEHRHYSEPVDLEIQKTYQAISRGQVVVKALESIVTAGVGEDGFPRLAIWRADAATCYVEMRSTGGARMSMDRWPREAHNRRYIEFTAGSFPRSRERSAAQAIVPLVPIDLRPAAGSKIITSSSKRFGRRRPRSIRCCCAASARPIFGSSAPPGN
jgi:hypothetical protein